MIIWYSESQDWQAVDRYTSAGEPYFERTITFAQHPIRAIVRQRTSNDRPQLVAADAEGNPVQDPGFLPDLQLQTFGAPDGFPFPLPHVPVRRSRQARLPR
jgi:hypothetical protein